MQRWMNRDPLGDVGFLRSYSRSVPRRHYRKLRTEALGNLYLFSHNEPLVFIDPVGLSNYWQWSKWDWNPLQACLHVAFDMGAVPTEAVLGLIDAADTGFSAGSENRSRFGTWDDATLITADGDIINSSLPLLNNSLRDAIGGIPATSITGDVPTIDPVGIGSGIGQGLLLGPGMQGPE